MAHCAYTLHNTVVAFPLAGLEISFASVQDPSRWKTPRAFQIIAATTTNLHILDKENVL
jgi:hypothetical protein